MTLREKTSAKNQEQPAKIATNITFPNIQMNTESPSIHTNTCMDNFNEVLAIELKTIEYDGIISVQCSNSILCNNNCDPKISIPIGSFHTML